MELHRFLRINLLAIFLDKVGGILQVSSASHSEMSNVIPRKQSMPEIIDERNRWTKSATLLMAMFYVSAKGQPWNKCCLFIYLLTFQSWFSEVSTKHCL